MSEKREDLKQQTFIRPGKELPLAKPARQIDKIDMKDLKEIRF
jgi:hypothetical protein